MTVTIADIEAARRIIAGAVLRTPMLPAPRLSALTGAEVFVKYENLQVTNSFKDRGAFVKLASLTEAERRRGVIAMSAGNHAQAVAYHAARLGIPATIVMPVTTPFVKVAATRSHGAEVVLRRRDRGRRAGALRRDRSRARADTGASLRRSAHHRRAGHHRAGNAGRGCRPRHHRHPDRRRRADRRQCHRGARDKPGIEIVGAESALYPSMWNALRANTAPSAAPTLAEGIAVKNVGKLTLPVVRELVAEIILVDEAQLERAVNAFLTLQKRWRKAPAPPASLRCWRKPERFRGKKVGLVLSGGNIDPRILASIMVRELERESHIVSFRLTMPDRPGVLGQIATRLGELGANILEVDHRRLFLDVPAKGAKLDVTIETRDAAHAEEIRLRA